MARNSRKLRMQALEAKNMMAGDVAVQLFDGDLYINEAQDGIGQDQTVYLYSEGNGVVRVAGFDGTQIDGHGKSAKFAVDGDIHINLGGGSDEARLYGRFGAENVDINMASNRGSMGSSDNDVVVLSGLMTSDDVKVETGNGNDYVSLSYARIGNSIFDSVDIDTGSGDDIVSIGRVDVSGKIDVETSSGEDEVRLSKVVADRVFADLGDNATGWDAFYLEASDIDGDVEVEGRGGNDWISLYDSDADEFNIDGGDGTNYLWAAAVDVDDIDDENVVRLF